MSDRVHAIVDFWIGSAADDPAEAGARTRLWYQGGAAGDEEIRTRFGEDLAAAEAGEYDDWCETAAGALALVILLDQFSRNLYRGTARAFSNDEKAQRVARTAVEQEFHRQLSPIGVVFLLHPFHHAEDERAQDQCVSMYEALADRAGDEWQSLMDSFLEYARDHRAVVRRFGRVPHRNDVLGRRSTPQETEYLESGARRYGQ